MDTTEPPAMVYELSLKGNGVAIQREIPEQVAVNVIALIMGGRVAGGRVVDSRGPARSASISTTGTSPGEFLTDTGVKRNPDKIVALAVYMTDELGKDSFSRDDVRRMFQEAGEPIPGNFTRDFTWAVRNRWIGAVIGSSNEYRVTNKGREAVQQKFSPAILAASRQPVGKRRRQRRANGDEAEGAE